MKSSTSKLSNQTGGRVMTDELDKILESVYYSGYADGKDSESGYGGAVDADSRPIAKSAIQALIRAHTNAEIAKVLDRLDKQSVLYENRTPDDYQRDLIPLSAIQAERAKLKEVK